MEVDDDDKGMDFIRNVAPRHPSRILERSDGSDDDDGEVEIPCSSRRSSFIGDDCPPLVEVEDDNDEESEEAEESAEAELGQLHH